MTKSNIIVNTAAAAVFFHVNFLIRDGNVGLNGNISTPAGWISMKVCSDIHGPQRMNPLPPPAGQSFHLSQHLLDALARHFVKTFHGFPDNVPSRLW